MDNIIRIIMSSYIIAGSADSLDTAYCEEIARRIKAKYKNIDFRIVIKHPSEWEDYLQQICRIYGFLNKSNPIIYTYHGKIIGNKELFIETAVNYFGLKEDVLIVNDLTTQINMKLAENQIKQKNIVKNNIKTLQQKIESTYLKLLKNGQIKHEFKDRQSSLVNGIEYQCMKISGICPKVKFEVNRQVPIEKQVVQPQNIDLAKLTALDKIPEQGKQAFVTNNQQINTESIEKMSEASRTNRLHSSVMSRDGDSKVNKESSKQKQQIDEQFDDVADFSDHPMGNLIVSEVGDNFYLAFENDKNSYLPGEMVLYLNESQNNGNTMRIYNDGRAVIGHRNLIKEIHYEVNHEMPPLAGEEQNEQKEEGENVPSIEKIQESSKQLEAEVEGQKNEKSKTQPNILESHEHKVEPKEEQILSQAHSDLNLISNLNYHTLYILKPLSQNELKRILYLTKQTDTLACLQFLPQNPNPKIKVYNRAFLLGEKNCGFPVEKFISKQLEDGEFSTTSLPQETIAEEERYEVKTINDIGFSHYYIENTAEMDDEKLAKVLKYTIDELLNIEELLKKQIGYNLIFTKQYTLVVALSEPYKTYGTNSYYFDGLAYLGYVCVVEGQEGYQMKKKAISSGEEIREVLGSCSGYQHDD